MLVAVSRKCGHAVYGRTAIACNRTALPVSASRASASQAPLPSPGSALSSPSTVAASEVAAATAASRAVTARASTDVNPAAGQSSLALPAKPSRAIDIVYKGPIAEDDSGGARHSTSIGAFWSNIPGHVRASFQSPTSMDAVPRASAPLLLDSIVAQARALIASTGLPTLERWSAEPPATYYSGALPLAPHRKGQTAAYNYTRVLVPRELAYRVPLNMYVDPVFQTSDPDLRLRMRGQTIFPRLQGRTTLLLTFSGQPLSGLFTGLKHWLDVVGEEFLSYPKTQVLKLHCSKGWFNRRTHQLTKFHLRRQVEDDEQFSTFVYRGKWHLELERALHLYDSALPGVLLVDPLAYVRWHAVGLPTDDATNVFRALAQRLAHEKKTYT